MEDGRIAVAWSGGRDSTALLHATLVAAVRELGQLTGVQTPFTDALLGLARLQARVRGLY